MLTYTVFMKNNYFQKNIVRRMALFYVFANLCNAWLNRSQLNSRICFLIQPGQCVFQTQLYKENSALCRYIVGRW